jgi:hypothetical protein
MTQPPTNADPGFSVLDLVRTVTAHGDQLLDTCRKHITEVSHADANTAQYCVGTAIKQLEVSRNLLWHRAANDKKQSRIRVFLREAVRVVFYFIPTALLYAFGAFAGWRIGPDFMSSVRDPLTLISGALGLVALLSLLAIFRRRRLGIIGDTGTEHIVLPLFSTYLPQPRTYLLMQIPLAFIPLGIMMIDKAASWSLLEPACTTSSLSDYFLLTLDSLAKGAVVDFFESFRINLYACGVNEGSFVASLIVFAIRSFSTYVIVYTIVRVFLRARAERGMLT